MLKVDVIGVFVVLACIPLLGCETSDEEGMLHTERIALEGSGCEGADSDDCSGVSGAADEACPADASYKNHGAYVSCASGFLESLADTAAIPEDCADAIMERFARSCVGRPAGAHNCQASTGSWCVYRVDHGSCRHPRIRRGDTICFPCPDSGVCRSGSCTDGQNCLLDDVDPIQSDCTACPDDAIQLLPPTWGCG